jgi:hypothetical protein
VLKIALLAKKKIQVSCSYLQDFIMFKKDSFQPVISISLTWETFEQYALWQLLLGKKSFIFSSASVKHQYGTLSHNSGYAST